jgi:hypothetical protein
MFIMLIFNPISLDKKYFLTVKYGFKKCIMENNLQFTMYNLQ